MGLDVSSPGLGPSQGRLSLETCLQVKDQSRWAVVAVTLIYLHLALCPCLGVENRENTEIPYYLAFKNFLF